MHRHHHSTADLENLGVSGPLVHGSSGSDVLHTGFGNEGPASATEMLTADQIDAVLMRHDQVIPFSFASGFGNSRLSASCV